MVPQALERPLTPAANRVIAAYMKLDHPTQADVGRALDISRQAVHKQLTRDDVSQALATQKAKQLDKATGVVAKLTSIVRRVVSGVDACIDRSPCDHCGNQPVTIQELAGMLKVSTDGLKTMLELQDQHGLGKSDPSDPQALRSSRTRDRARVMRLTRAITGTYRERLR